ncbi:hypothetical protein F511_33774 [Dorcoceras hygrometricum]|uniref:Uncharacterized protein n=1 Tax=Dorcoceras hygrometricum TaxID=472368 RepID=A0A2Z7BJZ9_9LAMI|nr:hypothetical protein F511_33774 [Dorcoceras hygrometricum]
MAQYQILARKPLGHPGQARKSKESKNSVATPPRVRQTAATRRRPSCEQCAAARVPACGSYSADVRRLQCRRATATVPACGGYSATVGGGRSSLIRSTTGNTTPSSACTRRPDEFGTNGISSTRRSEQVRSRRWRHGGAAVEAAAVRQRRSWKRITETSPLCSLLASYPSLLGLVYCCIVAVVSYQDARASGNTALSSPCWDLLATMRRVENQVLQLVVVLTQLAVSQEVSTRPDTRHQQLDARELPRSCFGCSPYWGLTPCPSGAWFVSLFVLFSGNPGFTACRGFNQAGGVPGGG